MAAAKGIQVGRLKKNELEEADGIVRLAFGTFLGLPNPTDFMGDRDFLGSRWRAPNTEVLAAREHGRLIGSNVVTRWGSFGFFGPLTILPEYWNQGIAQRLLEATVKIFERQGLTRTGLFTFPHSAKHVGLYQKFGYWPGYLTALMSHAPQAEAPKKEKPGQRTVYLSAASRADREMAIAACGKLTDKLDKGLDLGDEIRSLLKQKTGEAVLTYTRGTLDGFAVCLNGPGSEGGAQTCYIKFAAVRNGGGGGERFDQLLYACDAFALSRGAAVEAGMNLAREDAFRRMRAHGYRAIAQGVSMQRPHTAGLNRGDVYAIEDWR